MATFDDMEPERKVTIYDKGFDENSDSYGEYVARAGEIRSPLVPNTEPLRLECEHFIECVREGRTPRSDGEERPAGRADPRGAAAGARRLPAFSRAHSLRPAQSVCGPLLPREPRL